MGKLRNGNQGNANFKQFESKKAENFHGTERICINPTTMREFTPIQKGTGHPAKESDLAFHTGDNST